MSSRLPSPSRSVTTGDAYQLVWPLSFFQCVGAWTSPLLDPFGRGGLRVPPVELPPPVPPPFAGSSSEPPQAHRAPPDKRPINERMHQVPRVRMRSSRV